MYNIHVALKQAFREVDVNNDNSLSVEELRAVFKKQGGFTDKEIHQFLKDADKNGTVSALATVVVRARPSNKSVNLYLFHPNH